MPLPGRIQGAPRFRDRSSLRTYVTQLSGRGIWQRRAIATLTVPERPISLALLRPDT
jgi:hypothetical protein